MLAVISRPQTYIGGACAFNISSSVNLLCLVPIGHALLNLAFHHATHAEICGRVLCLTSAGYIVWRDRRAVDEFG